MFINQGFKALLILSAHGRAAFCMVCRLTFCVCNVPELDPWGISLDGACTRWRNVVRPTPEHYFTELTAEHCSTEWGAPAPKPTRASAPRVNIL